MEIKLRIRYFWQNLHNKRYQQSYSRGIQKHALKYGFKFCCYVLYNHLHVNKILAEKKCVLYRRLYGSLLNCINDIHFSHIEGKHKCFIITCIHVLTLLRHPNCFLTTSFNERPVQFSTLSGMVAPSSYFWAILHAYND